MLPDWRLLLLPPLLLLSAAATSGEDAEHYPGIGPCNSMYHRPCVAPNIRFFLYTRSSPEEGEEVAVDPEGNLKGNSSLDPRHPTKIVIHGYNSNKDLSYLVDIRKGYLESAPHNMLAADWSAFSNGPWYCYPAAAENAGQAARCVAQLVLALARSGAGDTHLVGFSVGAHVAGMTANHLGDLRLERITGLDPAMPLFATRGPEERLDSGDALFVDVVHTNALVQGMVQQCGHVDFYVNGGLLQPGCGSVLNSMACSHHRAPAYFAESITSDEGFWGWRCPGLLHYALGLCAPKLPAAVVGANATTARRGFHVVRTASQAPYALGEWWTS
ncbi:pancreatic lipase-related protein 2-like [Bacillus rossius redtenbacheri]|uniref:pancreatic lipase-related protein 2-like n=1 Tax=Bacillus rossius redtenbacheri TaxID=93214 RepID=UPI002FDD4537